MQKFAGLDRSTLRTLIAAIACITVFDITLGLSFPLFSLILEDRGHSAVLIGLVASFGPLGVLAAGPFIPRLTARFGSRRLALACCFLVAVVLLLFRVFESLYIWFPLRFLLGALACVLFAVSEAWIVRSAEGPYRGRITAVYASVLSGGFALGPALLPFTGYQGWAPFIIGAAIMIVAMLPIAFVEIEDRLHHGEKPASFFGFFPQAPVILLGVGAFALLDAAVLAFLPLYGISRGLSVDMGALALTVLVGGNFLLQFPIGWIGDHIPRRRVMLACSLITAASCDLLPHVMGHWLMWPVLVLLGACGFGIYTTAIAILGETFKGASLVAGTAAFATMWGLGGMLGPAIAGWSIELAGADGLPFMLSALFVIFSVLLIARAGRN